MEVNDSPPEQDAKRPRTTETRLSGKCYHCGIHGHRQNECKKRREEPKPASSRTQDSSYSFRNQDKKTDVTCYSCGKLGHLSPSCPEKKSGGGVALKEINLCEHRLSRATLETSSGEQIPFLFDSGSSCSLVKESYFDMFPGTERNSLVYLAGTKQILSRVKIGDMSIDLLFHAVSDNGISDAVIIEAMLRLFTKSALQKLCIILLTNPLFIWTMCCPIQLILLKVYNVLTRFCAL